MILHAFSVQTSWRIPLLGCGGRGAGRLSGEQQGLGLQRSKEAASWRTLFQPSIRRAEACHWLLKQERDMLVHKNRGWSFC